MSRPESRTYRVVMTVLLAIALGAVLMPCRTLAEDEGRTGLEEAPVVVVLEAEEGDGPEETVSEETTDEGEMAAPEPTDSEIDAPELEPEATEPEPELPMPEATEDETPFDGEDVNEGEPADTDGDLVPQGEPSYAYGNVSVSWSPATGVLELQPIKDTNGKLSDPINEDDDDWPWASYAEEITTVRFKKYGSTYVVASTCYDLFKGCTNLYEVDLSGLDDTEALNFEDMFAGCSKLCVLKVGDRYNVCPSDVPTKNHAFPANPRGLSYWWSNKDGAFVTLSSIRKNRSGVGHADVYKAGVSLTNVSLVDMGDDVQYTGSPIKVVPRLYMPKEAGGKIELAKNKDFKVLEYGSDVVNAGNTYVRIGSTNKGYCEDATGTYVEYPYTINPRSINEVDIEMDAGFDYEGTTVAPEPILTFNGMTLVKGTDYTLSYKNNDKPGVATLTITGKGNYSGKAYVDFEILNPLTNLAYAKVTGVEDVVYNGQPHAPEPTVTLNGNVLTRGKDYSIYYEDNVKPGIAYVNIEAISPYDGGTFASFIIAFTDVPKSFWGYKKVHEAASLGLVGGYSGAKDGQYGPNDNVTRGQAAVMLWNMAEKPEPGESAKDFPDVADPKAYYYKAVRWASGAGVISGYASTGTFGPNDLVTREQLAVMIANYAGKVKGLTLDGSAADYAAMKDAASVSTWARPSIGWCYKNAIMGGTSDGRINPQGNATRAETAKMMVGLFYLVSE